jgi:ribosomal protein S18 acetylase RimI-like enzyme
MMGISSDPSAVPHLRRVALPGDRTLSIRAMVVSDANGLLALYAGLDEDDLYRRFFTAHAPPERFVEKMTKVAERGGIGLVATVDGRDGTSKIVAEATCELLPDGDAELGITVAKDARGWLGPYLLDTLVEEAAARGVRNLQAEVLVANRQMLALLRARGLAIIDHDAQPAIVRVAIGTTRRVPSWPGPHDRPRLLVEVRGGWWRTEAAARAAGFQVLACPGPSKGWSRCPALCGEPCPLAAGADVIVDAQPGELGRSIVEAHRHLHPSVPVCIELPPEEGDLDAGLQRIPRGADDAAVIGIVQRLAKRPPGEGGDRPEGEPS